MSIADERQDHARKIVESHPLKLEWTIAGESMWGTTLLLDGVICKFEIFWGSRRWNAEDEISLLDQASDYNCWDGTGDGRRNGQSERVRRKSTSYHLSQVLIHFVLYCASHYYPFLGLSLRGATEFWKTFIQMTMARKVQIRLRLSTLKLQVWRVCRNLFPRLVVLTSGPRSLQVSISQVMILNVKMKFRRWVLWESGQCWRNLLSLFLSCTEVSQRWRIWFSAHGGSGY